MVDAISKEIFRLATVIKKFGKLDDHEEGVLLYILEIYEELKKKRPSVRTESRTEGQMRYNLVNHP